MEAPTPTNEKISETIILEQNSVKYTLNLNSERDIITFSLNYNSSNYTKKISLKEIKDQESKAIFYTFSPKDFFEFLKKSAEMKKIEIIQKDNNFKMRIQFEAMFKKHEINIELISKDTNLELIEKELNKIITENKELKRRIENIENEMKEIKKMLEPKFNINKIKISNDSVIMKENEFNLIHLAIKSRLNKEVKELKKLYQATIDGDDSINFHTKCDNIPNTLVLIKSAGNRRFGGFTSVQWSSPSSYEFKDDPNSFVFSLDKQKIYPYKNNGKAIYYYKDYGPCFGCGFDIGIGKYCIQQKSLFTYESNTRSSFNYYRDKNALSESVKGNYIYAVEYEVFQVIFS